MKNTYTKGGPELHALTARLPQLPDDPRHVFGIMSEHLRSEGFGYRDEVSTLEEVISSKGGSCLGLSLLAATLLAQRERMPECKILIHPRDAVDKADQKLFSELMQGEYFDYDCPVLPTISDQPRRADRINRFVPLCHPLVMLGDIPLETTLMFEQASDSLVEYSAESSSRYGPEILESYVLSDQAKLLFRSMNKQKAPSKKVMSEFYEKICKSLEIFPRNRDALNLQWKFGCTHDHEEIKKDAKQRLLDLETSDSDLSYKLWIVTGDVQYLDAALEQFPEHILAFLDRKVFLEPDPREARMNLAVALWCITYASTFDLKEFLRDREIKGKIAELFP